LLAGARALLVPSRAPETSSLVAMEALASGTPVIAFPSGALPSIVEHGKSGFIVDDAAAMARAIESAGDIDAGACRAAAEARFAIETTTSRYLATYERLASPGTAFSLRTAARALPLVVDEIRGTAALEALAPEWSALWQRCPSASPFQSPAWLVAYARAFCAEGSGAEAGAIAVRRGGALVGVAPLCTRRAANGVATTLLGEGVSDYLDVVVDPEVERACVARIMGALRQRAKTDGHAVVLDSLRECSPLLTWTDPDQREGEIAVGDACPMLRLVAGIDPVPRGMRDKLRYYRRRAERAGGADIVEIADASGDAAAGSTASAVGWLDTLFALHGARWAARGERGVLDAPELRAFHADAFAALAAAGTARLYGLTIGGRRAAAMLVLRDRTAAYYYIGGFAPELAPVSPGTLLVAHVIDRARADLLCELDFLRGREAYKYQFGAVDRFTRTRRVERRADVPLRRESGSTMTQTDAS
jgi:CelD/BcsL family acetyltransferase involved in cellulose biosynthesis